jgi:7-alpha-hydroxysteroid dehydrogenase
MLQSELQKEINDEGGNAIALKCDVTIDQELLDLVDNTLKTFKQIHILVNNVGGGGGGKENPFEIDVDQFRGVFERNLFSMWRLSQLVAPHMKIAGYGSIINMSSMASIDKSPSMSAYASSKAAINHMTRNLAFDYGPEIRINAIGPGAIKTDALASVLTDDIEEKMLKHTPLGRLGEPDDIAGAVLYFATPISKWVSGQVIFVNGGGNQTLE